ncbi:MAG: hypothetical protein DYG98_03455 [Haliscomenobacteraceae bacterium CHB4]|nr:hypothetical protein [Haliscomenobacteraceae bacterium CHB4]
MSEDHHIEPGTATACPCPNKTTRRKQSSFPFLFAVLVAILPKCPFCVLGYSGVLMLCSGTRQYHFDAHWTNFIPVGATLLVCMALLFNSKGRRTRWALGFALSGGLLVTLAQTLTGSNIEYYTGTGLIFFAVFLNGSLPFFWRKALPYLNKTIHFHFNRHY